MARPVREREAATPIEYAIGLLAARSLPEKKLRERLRKRYGESETDAAITRLRELRMVDDAVWAERFVRDRFERMGKGRHRLRAELLARGIDEASIGAALDHVLGGDAERARAAAVLETMRARLTRNGSASPPDTEASDAGQSAGRTAGRVAGAPPRRRTTAAESEKNRLFRRMLARGYPAALVRDLLDVS